MRDHVRTFGFLIFAAAMSLWSVRAAANVILYINWDCEGYSLDMDREVNRSSISSLKDFKYTYSCRKTRTIHHGEDSEEYWGTCEKSFNDNIRSVELDEYEQVTLYEDTNFHGSFTIVGWGPGCWNLGGLADEVSSVTKGGPYQHPSSSNDSDDHDHGYRR
jgi:hypothetical protein